MRGGVGAPPGLIHGGFGEIGEVRLSFNKMVARLSRVKDISDNVEADNMNTEKNVKELGMVFVEVFKASGAMLQQERLGFIAMITAAGSIGASGVSPCVFV